MGKNRIRKDLPIQKVVVLLAEGDTDVEFYEQVLKNIKRSVGEIPKGIRITKPVNMKGITRYSTRAEAQFDLIKKKVAKSNKKLRIYNVTEYYVFLCIDSDVFEFEENPPLDKKELKKSLLEIGAKEVNYIEAVHSIEDWFLIDFEGIKKYLNLKLLKKSNIKGNNGAEKLNNIFNKAGKSYEKGLKSKGFIESLDISLIMENRKKELCPLYTLFYPQKEDNDQA